MKTYGMWNTLRLALINTARPLAPYAVLVLVIFALIWILSR